MATTKGPGKSYRKGMSLLEVTEQFNTVEKGEQWFIEQRWPIAGRYRTSLGDASLPSGVGYAA